MQLTGNLMVFKSEGTKMDKTYNNTNRISSYSIVLRTISWIVLITFGWQQITYGYNGATHRSARLVDKTA